MNRPYPKNIVFLDVDGVCNSFGRGSHATAKKDEDYGIDEETVKALVSFCGETDSGIVISSNWRRFPENGTLKFKDIVCRNPLPRLKEILGELVVGTLTTERHLTKSEATILWFEDNPDFKGNFVIFDDDPGENYQDTADYGISRHFVLTTMDAGLTKGHLEYAGEILKRKENDNLDS